MHVVLFDIDGTLVSKRGTEAKERERFRLAVLDIVGKSPPIDPWRYDGMVDPEICRRLLIDAGLNANAAASNLEKVIRRVGEIYLTMDMKPVLNGGVEKLLRILSASSSHKLGVLTGNLSIVAERKLRLAHIRPYFAETFYSNGHFDRSDLVRDAVRACKAKYRVRGSKAMTIVGDTPRDIEAANANGVEVIAVSSGFYSATELERAGARAVFSTLEPSNELLKALHFEE
jgi:phosphoglycolate phosphatase-like HAD superfamily hydrolase